MNSGIDIFVRDILETIPFDEQDSLSTLSKLARDVESAENTLNSLKDSLSVFLENHVKESGKNTVRLNGKQYTISSRKGAYYLKRKK